MRILTYERGVEDYTLACGTGCGSTAAVLYALGQLPDGALTLQNPGGTLTVRVSGAPLTDLILEGPTRILKIYDL